MEINRKNFEAFFLDFWEGNLSETQKESLIIFLENNPDLRDLFYDYQEVRDIGLVPDESVIFHAKNLLKKNELQPVGNVNQDNWESFAIASLEDDLTPGEMEDFRKFVQLNPLVVKTIDHYRKVYLKPDFRVIFPDKGKLKKTIPLFSNRNVARWTMAAAAAVILGLAVFSVLINREWVGFESQVSQQNLETRSQSVNNHKIEPVLEKASNKTSPEQLADNTAKSIYGKRLKEVDNTSLPAETNPFSEAQPSLTKDASILPKHLKTLAVAQLVFAEKIENVNPEGRNEFSTLFGDLMLRDFLKSESEMVADRGKTTLGKIIANMGNRFIDAATSEEVNNSLVVQLASKGKEKVTGIPGLLPVYRTNESEGKKETFLAISEGFSIYRSKTTDDNKPEKTINEP